MSASDRKCRQNQNVAKFVGFIRNLISEKKHSHFFRKSYILLLSEGRMKIILTFYYIKHHVIKL